MNESYYDLLEVADNASPDEIESSYQRIVSYLDTSSLAIYSMMEEDEVARMRTAVDEAYRTLSNPDRRAAYDRALSEGHEYFPVMVPESTADSNVSNVSVGHIRSEPHDEPRGESLEAPRVDSEARHERETTREPSTEPSPSHAETVWEAREPVGDRPESVREARESVGNRPESVREARESVGDWSEPVREARESVGNRPESVREARESVGDWSEPVREARESVGDWSEPVREAREPMQESPMRDWPEPQRESRPPAESAPPLPRNPEPAHRPLPKPQFRRLTPTLDVEVGPDTEFSGSLLRRLRESADASLEDLAEITKINKRYLHAIEENDFATLPAAVYVRGFVSEYARALGLNPQAVAKSYMALYQRYKREGGA